MRKVVSLSASGLLGLSIAVGGGVTLTQAHLAGSAYLQTDASDGTPWADGRMRVGLNRWLGDSYYVNDASPSGTQFKNHVYADIQNKGPLAADAVEFKDGVHYNNHPKDRTIGHWLTAYGYTDAVAKTRFTDSSHSSHVSWGDLPNQYFAYDTTDFADIFLHSNGVTW